MEYQLVLQFEAADVHDFDQLVAFEDALTGDLRGIATIDGHDFGRSEFNIFILTARPAAAFQRAYQLYDKQRLRYSLRAGYRELTAESYIVLWPTSLTEFNVA